MDLSKSVSRGPLGDADFLRAEDTANSRYLDTLVKKHLVCRILPRLETEQDGVLMKCIPSF